MTKEDTIEDYMNVEMCGIVPKDSEMWCPRCKYVIRYVIPDEPMLVDMIEQYKKKMRVLCERIVELQEKADD